MNSLGGEGSVSIETLVLRPEEIDKDSGCELVYVQTMVMKAELVLDFFFFRAICICGLSLRLEWTLVM